MEDLNLPPRLITPGYQPLGVRVNVYQKVDIIRRLTDSLSEEEINFLKESLLGKLLDFPSQIAWSGSFGLYLLSRQLIVKKENEIWILFAGKPIRFSIREFKIVTGLPCGKIPVAPKKKRKGTAGLKEPFYGTLFGLEKDVTVERVLSILKRKSVGDFQMRLRYACLVLVDGYLLPTSHFPRIKIKEEHAEMVEDLEAFLKYPWGRVSFNMMMGSLKERDISDFMTKDVAVQGLFYALQLVILKAVPAICEGPPVTTEGESESDATPDEGDLGRLKLKVFHAKEVDAACEAAVESIICPDYEFGDDCEEFRWSGDEGDERVETMLALIKDQFEFKPEMFFGGSLPTNFFVSRPNQKGRKKGRTDTRLKGGKGKAKGRLTGNDPADWRQGVHQASTSMQGLHISEDRFAEMLREQESRIIVAVQKAISDNNIDICGCFNKIVYDSIVSNNLADVARMNTYSSNNTISAPRSEASPRVGSLHQPNMEDIRCSDRRTGHFTEPISSALANQVHPVNLEVVLEEEENPELNHSLAENLAQEQESTLNKTGLNDFGYQQGMSVQHASISEGNGEGIAEQRSPVLGTDHRNEDPPTTVNNVITDGQQDEESLAREGNDQDDPWNAIPRDDQHENLVGVGNGGHPTEIPLRHPDMKVSEAHVSVLVSTASTDLDGPTNKDVATQGDVNNGGHEAGNPLSHSAHKVSEAHVPDLVGTTSNDPYGPSNKDVVTQGQVVNVSDIQSRRISKRSRTLSSRLDARFDCGKRMRTMFEPQGLTESNNTAQTELDSRYAKALASVTRSIKIENSVLLTLKDIMDVVVRDKVFINKVVDALLLFSRRMLRADHNETEKLRVEIVDTKFVSTLSRIYPKFCQTVFKSSFIFPNSLVDSIRGVGDPQHFQLYEEADTVYAMVKVGMKHWVSLAIGLRERKIEVLDSNLDLHTNTQIDEKVQCFAEMLPHLLRQVSSNTKMRESPTTPFVVYRVRGIPQVKSVFDSGIVSIFMIQTHASQGLLGCKEFDIQKLEGEIQKLLTVLIEHNRGSVQ